MNETHITQSDIDRYMPILRGLKQFEKDFERGEFIISTKHHKAQFARMRPSIHLQLTDRRQQAKVI